MKKLFLLLFLILNTAAFANAGTGNVLVNVWGFVQENLDGSIIVTDGQGNYATCYPSGQNEYNCKGN